MPEAELPPDPNIIGAMPQIGLKLELRERWWTFW
jgi:hypothetical protein